MKESHATCFLACFCSAFGIALAFALAGGDPVTVDEVMTKYREGPFLWNTQQFPHPSKAAVELMSRFAELPDFEKRRRLVGLAGGLESQAVGPPFGRSRNGELAKLFVKAIVSEPHRDVRRIAALTASALFPPTLLDPYAEELRTAAVSTVYPEPELTVLYGLLPSTTREALDEIVSRHPTRRRRQYAELGVLARHGDTDAEKLLLAEFGRYRHPDINLLIAVSHASTRAVKVHLAKELTSEQLFGNRPPFTPVRGWCAYALSLMMSDTADFPLPPRGLLDCMADEPLDAIQAWCTANLGVTYPDGPRKQLDPWHKP